MALLRGVRDRGRRLTGRRRALVAPAVALWVLAASTSACAEPDPRYLPDEVLRAELGLTDADRVHSVRITGGRAEVADPTLDSVPAGAWLQFVSADWLVHEVAFQVDSMAADARRFLEDSDQVASPPLLERDARFVVSLEGAPAGLYPYVLQGNGGPGGGLIVVVETPRE